MKRYIRSSRVMAAEGGGEDVLLEAIEDLQADVDYILDGFDKLQRMGVDKSKQALSIVLDLSAYLQTIIISVNDSIAGGSSGGDSEEPE